MVSVLMKNRILGIGLGVFVGSVYMYTIRAMAKVGYLEGKGPRNHFVLMLYRLQDDFEELENVTVINAHQSGALKATNVMK